MFKYFIVISFVVFQVCNRVESQSKTDIKIQLGAEGFVSDGDQAPMWMVSNQNGRWGNVEPNQLLTFAKVYMGKELGANFNIESEAEIDYSSGLESVFLHTGYLKASWKGLSFQFGRHTFSPIFEPDYAGVGAYLFGNNYRPMTRITFGLSQFKKLPVLKGRLEIRGEISHGRLDDGNGFYNHNHTLLHEKYAYIRWDGNKWLPYAGLNHSVFMGGYNSYGDKIPIDYWRSIFAKSSEKIGGGDATNAGGAHMGLYDFGLYRKFPNATARFYYQIPFADKSGMFFWKRNIDQIVGVNVLLKNKKWIQNLTVEWINTAHQTGNGIPDALAVYPDGSHEVLPRSVLLERDLNELMEKLGQGRIQPYTLPEVMAYLQKEFNKGREYGGRDGYLNNGVYPVGWTYYGMVMGSPLNLTRVQIGVNSPNLGIYTNNFIVNDRVKAIHVGGNGVLNENWQWRGKFTYSVNYGSYYNQYPGRYTWVETEDYYFSGGLKQFYGLIGISWYPLKINGLELISDFAFDAGEMFNSFGLRVGTRWLF